LILSLAAKNLCELIHSWTLIIMTFYNQIITEQLIISFIITIGAMKVLIVILRKWNDYQKSRYSERCRVLLKNLYHDIDPCEISLRYRKQEDITHNQYIHGEIIFSSFSDILAFVKPKKNEIFYDLGCGGGKAIFTAALLYPDIIVRGVESLPPLYDLCQSLQCSLVKMMRDSQYFKHHPLNVEFISGDLTAIDFSEANIVYLNVTCFDSDIWERICEKLEALPVNARVIITSKYLNSENFDLIDQQSHLMSWGMNTVNIYLKKR
jgi:hypothetical protein